MEQIINDIERVLFNKEEIAEGVGGAAAWLDRRLKNSYPLAVCVLKGSVMFYCDLIRAMKLPVQLDFISVSSYGAGTKSAGNIKIIADLSESIEGRDVILVEDIVDSGHTLKALTEILLFRGARSVTTVALLDKTFRREVDVEADYSCFSVGNDFIVGYGLDFDQKYRDLPYIGVLKKCVYEKDEEGI